MAYAPFAHDYAVRPAVGGDAVACRMLLPEFQHAAQWWVATQRERPARVVGAAAMLPETRQAADEQGPGVGLRVIAPCRGRGLGRALAEQLAAAATAAGHQAMYVAQRVDLDDESLAAWQALDFIVTETSTVHELALDAVEARLGPLMTWLQQREATPADAQLTPLYRAAPERVVELHLRYLGGDPTDLRQRICGGGPNAFHPRYSLALHKGEALIGCLLARRIAADRAAIDAVIVAPEYRQGWANLWLKHAATRQAAALGIETFEFTTFDRYADTRKFAQLVGGRVLSRKALLKRRLKGVTTLLPPTAENES